MSEEFNLEERILCEDDTCIGLVGSDRKCKVCGRVYEGSSPLPKGGEDSADSEISTASMESSALLSETDKADPGERIPCLDDLCVGIIGPDGKCGTCGKSTSDADSGE